MRDVTVFRGDKYLNYKVKFLKRSTDPTLNETVAKKILHNPVLIRTQGHYVKDLDACRACSLLHPLTTSYWSHDAALFIPPTDEVQKHGCLFAPRSDPIIHWPNDINSSFISYNDENLYFFCVTTALSGLKESYGEESLREWCRGKNIVCPFDGVESKVVKGLMTHCFPKHSDVAHFVEKYHKRNKTTYTETVLPKDALFCGYFVHNKKPNKTTIEIAAQLDVPVVTLTRSTKCAIM
jgi:hypothetical protein